MNEILFVTVPASLVLGGTLGARFLEHKLGKKRDIRDARRKYRESITAPVKQALTKLQTSLEDQSMVDYISKAQEKGISLKPETVKAIESLKELLQSYDVAQQWEAVTELLPLAAAITNEKVREHVMKAVLYFGMGKKIRGELNITDEDMDKVFNLAYQKLEDFVVLAD
jgi:hypothetical protein